MISNGNDFVFRGGGIGVSIPQLGWGDFKRSLKSKIRIDLVHFGVNDNEDREKGLTSKLAVIKLS